MNFSKLAVAVFMIAGATTAAGAADLGRGGSKDPDVVGYYETGTTTWTGARIGIGAGINITGFELGDLNAGTRNYYVQGELQYDYQFANSPLVAGARATVNYTDTLDKVGFGVDGQLGVALGNAKPFILAGYEWRDWPSGWSAVSNGGFAYGGGVDVLITKRLVAGVEWKRVDWGSHGATDFMEDRGVIRLSYKLN